MFWKWLWPFGRKSKDNPDNPPSGRRWGGDRDDFLFTPTNPVNTILTETEQSEKKPEGSDEQG